MKFRVLSSEFRVLGFGFRVSGSMIQLISYSTIQRFNRVIYYPTSCVPTISPFFKGSTRRGRGFLLPLPGLKFGDERSREVSSCFLTLQQSPETGDCRPFNNFTVQRFNNSTVPQFHKLSRPMTLDLRLSTFVPFPFFIA